MVSLIRIRRSMPSTRPAPTDHPLRLPGVPGKQSARAYWTCQAMGWGLYLVVTIPEARYLGMPLGRAVVEPTLAAALGVALTHLARRWLRPRRWLALGGASLALHVVVGSIAIATVFVALLSVVELGIYRDPQPSIALMMLSALVRWSLAFFVWLSIYLGYAFVSERRDAALRELRSQAMLRSAELDALKAQLNPHFLFNSLNGIRALAADDPAGTQNAITQLSRLLRYSLEATEHATVTVGRELEIVRDYLGLESLRLGERLDVVWEVDERAAAISIPVMLLQTLVENAIKHGIAALPGGGSLSIKVAVHDGWLSIEVMNPRPKASSVAALAPPSPRAGGVGLANARERVRLLYGDDSEAALMLDLSSPELARAEARIPLLGRAR